MPLLRLWSRAVIVSLCVGGVGCDAAVGEGEGDEGEGGEGEGDVGEGEGDVGEGEGEGEPGAAYVVTGTQLLDPCGEDVVLRGVNKMAVFADRAGDSFPEIASTGANTVRFMWVLSVPASEAVQTLQRAVDSHLVPIWEIHDATGDFSRMNEVRDFWLSEDTLAVLRQFEQRVIINIANEGGNAVDDDLWVSTYNEIIAGLRDAGIRSPVLVDAAGFGRNVEQLLRLAPAVMAADSGHNTLFSWHVYNPGQAEADRVDDAFAAASAAGIPLVVGEFGPVSPGACGQSVPYAHVVDAALAADVSWLAWSWDNFNGDCNDGSGSAFDMVADGIHAATLNAGYARDVVIDLPGSIRNTSVRTHFQETGSCR